MKGVATVFDEDNPAIWEVEMDETSYWTSLIPKIGNYRIIALGPISADTHQYEWAGMFVDNNRPIYFY